MNKPSSHYNHIGVLIISLAAFTFLSGCERTINRFNSDCLKQDLIVLLKRHNVIVSKLECKMVAGTRTGYCELELSCEQRDSLVNGLKLKEIDIPKQTLLGFSTEGCCSKEIFKNNTDTHLYRIGGRPENLRLESGSAFEYLELYFNESTGKACIEVCYSYS